MRSPNASIQASFYAPHLDRYFLRTDVDNHFVLSDKVDAIRRGRQAKTFDLEDVAVESTPDGSAHVRLVKHYLQQISASGSGERFVRSELSLRRFGGQWKITGERDFK